MVINNLAYQPIDFKLDHVISVVVQICVTLSRYANIFNHECHINSE